jgi:hypothetical protein
MIKVLAWTPDEVNKIINSLLENKTYEEVAKDHSRTVNSIKYKTLEYATNEVLNGTKTINEMMVTLNISEDDLKKELSRRKPKLVPSVVLKPKLKANIIKTGTVPLPPVLVPAVVKPKLSSIVKGVPDLSELKDILKGMDSLRSRLSNYIHTIESK